jgi:hypothetical protein
MKTGLMNRPGFGFTTTKRSLESERKKEREKRGGKAFFVNERVSLSKPFEEM